MTVNKIMIKTAINGNAENRYLLGRKYYFDENEKNDTLAAEWFKEAANKGHSAAMFMYGYMLMDGTAGKLNIKLGTRYVRRSAKEGYLQAILFLARNYYYGFGVEKNDKKAFKLWKKGSFYGCSEAEYYLGLCYAKGVGVKKNILKAKKHLINAYEGGFKKANIAMNDFGIDCVA